jgi:hypothetical protein
MSHASPPPVYDLNTIDPGAAPQVMVLSPDGHRLFVPTDSKNGGEILMFGITHPDTSRLLDKLELGANSGPDDSLLTRDNRLVLTDYFLNEDGFGKVHADGDDRIRVFPVGKTASDPTPLSISISTTWSPVCTFVPTALTRPKRAAGRLVGSVSVSGRTGRVG